MPNTLEQLREELKELNYLKNTIELMQWDQQVYMPKGAAEHRSDWMAYLEGICHEKQTSPKFSELLGKFVDLKNGQVVATELSDIEKRMVTEVWKDWRDTTSLPFTFVKEYAKLQSGSYSAWEKAKQSGEFLEFAPYLEQMIEKTKKRPSC